MRRFAETGVRHALDESFRRLSHLLPRSARVVIVGGDPGECCFRRAEMIEAIS